MDKVDRAGHAWTCLKKGACPLKNAIPREG